MVIYILFGSDHWLGKRAILPLFAPSTYIYLLTIPTYTPQGRHERWHPDHDRLVTKAGGLHTKFRPRLALSLLGSTVVWRRGCGISDFGNHRPWLLVNSVGGAIVYGISWPSAALNLQPSRRS